MNWRGDDRAQSVQVGAVLLFATLIIALSIYQATVVPQENSEVEYAAYQDAAADMLQLRNVVLAAAAGDGTRGVTFKTGAEYPPRIFLLNGLDPTGTVSTTDPGNVTLGNVDASSSEFENVGEYVAAEDGSLNYTSRRVVFEPDYNHLSAASMVTTNGFVYRAHGPPTRVAPQTLIRGNTITLTTIVGDLDASGYTAPVTAVPVSAHVNTVTVTNESSGPVTLTMPTRLNATEWEQSVLTGSGSQYVNDVTAGPRNGTVTIELAANQQYELRVARVELKERHDSGEADDPAARYLVAGSDRDLTTDSDGRVKLVAEARDALNNPRSNWPVTFDTDDGQLETRSGDALGSRQTVRTNEEGNAVVWFDKESTTATVTATLGANASGSAAETVTYSVSDGGSGAGGGSDAYDVSWSPSESDSQSAALTCSGDACTLDASVSQSVTLYAESSPVVDGGTFTYEVQDATDGTVSPTEDQTDSNGESSTTFTASRNGTTNVYVSGGGSGDSLELTVENYGSGASATPQISARVDDLTRNRENSGVFIGSYSLSNTNSSFERVDIHFQDETSPSQSSTLSSTATRAGRRYTGGGSGHQFEIVYEVIYTDASGDEYVAASTSISDVADAQNPSENADLGTSSTVSLTSWEFVDQSDTQQNVVRYQFSYDVTSSGSFSEVRAFALNVNTNGATTVMTRGSRSQNNQNLQPGDGAGTQYRVGLIVRDANGAVVDVVRIEDDADGSGTYSGP